MASLFFLALGTISSVIQNTFYGYIDENGILRDSLFLPLGVISLFLGGIILFFSIISLYFKKQ